MKLAAVILAVTLVGSASFSKETQEMISPLIFETTVDAPKAQVWRDWTTSEGAKTFFAPDADIDLAIGGKYELFFDQEQSKGLQGSEGCKVLSYLPEDMVSFSWNAPPIFPVERGEYTWVVLQLFEVETNKTRVKLTHLGWRTGGRRQEVREYFSKAWPYVFRNLEEKYKKEQPQ